MNTRRVSLGLFYSRKFAAVKAAGLAVAMALPALPVNAAQAVAKFDVMINLQSAAAPSQTGLCSINEPGNFGATVTVVCSTGTVTDISALASGLPYLPIHGGAYRFMTRVQEVSANVDIDSYTGVGTSTAMRVVRLSDREYIEMTVGW
jgi:hypothetical protein